MTQPISCAFSVSGEGAPLILAHGIGASRATWATALPLLKPHFTVIAYDLRGPGASPQPEGRFGLDALVADLEHVREQAGVEAAHALKPWVLPVRRREVVGAHQHVGEG